MKVWYLGPEGSFSYTLTLQAFTSEKYSLAAAESFRKIIEHVLEDPNAIGVLPIENSISSNVHENIDHILRNDVLIVGEAQLKVNLHLIGLRASSAEQIEDVYSHPMAIAQCVNYLSSTKKSGHDLSSTAEGQRKVLELGVLTNGALGGSHLVDDSRLEVLEKNVADQTNNKTRFVFIQGKRSKASGLSGDKASIQFRVKHEPGSLARILTEIAERNVNLTKLESRPIPGTDWEYDFWVDIESAEMDAVLKVVSKHTAQLNVLGMYTSGETYES